MYGILPELKTTTGQMVNGYPIVIHNPEKVAVVRLPTSDELIAYLSSQRTIITDLGSGKTRSESALTPSANSRLFRAIRLDKEGPEFDDAEMQKALGLITLHCLISCDRVGQTYVVKISTLFDDKDADTGENIPITHTVSIPFEKDVAEYRRGALVETSLRDNKTEQRFPVESAITLYNKIVQRIDGYYLPPDAPLLVDKGTVPPHHKKTVVNAVMSAFLDLNPSLDPNS